VAAAGFVASARAAEPAGRYANVARKEERHVHRPAVEGPKSGMR
jgi:hypothetical protein